MNKLPDLYFRIRDNGAMVFRLDTENRHRRLDMEQIAVVNITKGDFKAHGDRTVSPAERESIGAWIAARRATVAQNEVEAIRRMIEQMNMAAQWVHSRATDEQINDLTDDMLMAMHDLRTVLVRRKAEQLKDAE